MSVTDGRIAGCGDRRSRPGPAATVSVAGRLACARTTVGSLTRWWIRRLTPTASTSPGAIICLVGVAVIMYAPRASS